MAENFIVNRGLESKIPKQIQPGAIWFAEDSQNLYFDSNYSNKRIQITDVVDITNESDTDKLSREYYANKIYIDGTTLKKYNTSTKKLEVISQLENEVLESENEFVYDTNNPIKAILTDSSSPKKGTIVVDKNGEVGVVTSSNSTSTNVIILASNKFKNVLTGYDIYFDSNYDGPQVGTFECPFSDWKTLYIECEDMLKNNLKHVSIYFKSSSSLMLDLKLEGLNNITFIGNETTMFLTYDSFTIKDCENITFKNVLLTTLLEPSNIITLESCSNVHFINVNIDRNNIALIASSNIYFDNANLNTLFVGNNEDTTILENVYLNKVNVINRLVIFNITNEMNIIDSNIRRLSTGSTSNNVTIDGPLNINNTIINELQLLTTIDTVNLISGKLLNSNSICTIKSNNINLGTFNFNGVEPKLEGQINYLSGLSSIQVYDTHKNRAYGIPENDSLKSHLDKIGESIQELKDDKSNNSSSNVSGVFKTKGVFTSKDELLNGDVTPGDVMTYVAEAGQNIEFLHNLNLIDSYTRSEYDYSSMNYKGEVNLFSDLPENANTDDVYKVQYDDDLNELEKYYKFKNKTWIEIDIEEFKYEYNYYELTLENASYYAKYGDSVNLLNYLDINTNYNLSINENMYLTTKIHLVNDDKIIVKVKYDDLLNQIKEDFINIAWFSEDEALVLAEILINKDLFKLTSATLPQNIKVSHKDRLIKLSNGWDKLSGSTDDIAGNYHIVSSYGALNNIDNDATRIIGTLAYVQDDNMTYQWKYIDDKNTTLGWIEFSSGSGGGAGGSIITEMQYCAPNDENDSYYQFNFQSIKYPTIYYNDENVLTLKCYVNTAQSGPIMADITCRPTDGSMGEYLIIKDYPLVKRTNYIEIPKDKLYDGNAIYYVTIKDMYGYPFYICDKDGNSIHSKLSYIVSISSFKLATTFDDSRVYNMSNNVEIPYELTMSEDFSFINLGFDIYDEDRTNKITRLVIKDDNDKIEDKSEIGTYRFVPANIKDDNNQPLANGKYLLVLTAELHNLITDEIIKPEVVKNLVVMESNKMIIKDLSLLSTEIYNNNFTSIMYEFITTCSNNLYDIYYKFSNTEITEIGDIDTWNIIRGVQPVGGRSNITSTIHTPEVSGYYYLAIMCRLENKNTSNISNNVRVDVLSAREQVCKPNTNALLMSFDTQHNIGDTDTWNSKYISDGNVTVTTSHMMKLYNTTNVHGANGWNNKEYDGGENGIDDMYYDLEPNNVLSSNNYEYLKLFGDAYGIVLNDDGSEYSAFSEDISQGFTIECCFRANYPGNLNTTVLKIDGKNGIEIKPDSIKGWYHNTGTAIEKPLIENSWTHVIFTVNTNTTINDGSNYNRYIPMRHSAIYINGVLARANGITVDKLDRNSSEEGRIIFNKNKDIFGKTDIKVFRIYSRGFNAEDVLNNYHSCIKDEDIREIEVSKNNLKTSAALTEVYFIKNPNGKTNKDGTTNSSFANINTITDKAASKQNLVNSTVIIRTYTNNDYSTYSDDVYSNVDIGLQGTSTLGYPNKNYRINIYKDTEKGKKWKVQFKNPIDGSEWRQEYRYTMKCDYMESSHMNNTGIARFINNEVYQCSDTDEENIISGKRLSPIQRKYLNADNYNGYRTLIDGFPVMVFQTDGEDGKGLNISRDDDGNCVIDKGQFNVIGTYMFNHDKEAYENLGFIEEDSTGELVYPYAQSIEVSTNSATSAGAFNSWTGFNIDNDTFKPYTNQTLFYNDSMSARYQFEEKSDSGYLPIDIDNGEIYLGQKYVFENGIYQPISDTAADSYDGPLYRPCYNEDNICYNSVARLLNFVDKSSDEVFKKYIHKHINLSFALDYYIIVMIFGMVDNFGKNMMINTWNLTEDGVHIDPKYIDPEYKAEEYPIDTDNCLAEKCVQWYPTFYDMDTCNGLDNYGEERIKSNAEMPLDKLSGYIYKGAWDPAANHESFIDNPLKYTNSDDVIILDANGKLKNEYKHICDEEYYLIRKYVEHSTISAATSYPYYYMYPRDLIKMLALLNNDGTQSDMVSECESLIENVLKLDSTYKYYWVINIDTVDKDGRTIDSVMVGNDTFDYNTWLEFDCSSYALSQSTKETERFRFYNTSNSRLWSRIATLFQQEVYNRYNFLRTSKVLDVDNIIGFLEDFSSGRIPKAYFNINAIFKYMKLGEGNQIDAFAKYSHMCNGDRRVTLRKWLTERFIFIDTVLYNPLSLLPTIASNMNVAMRCIPSSRKSADLLIKSYSPCYIVIKRDAQLTGQILRKYVSADITSRQTQGDFTNIHDGQLFEFVTETNSAIDIYGITNISTLDSFNKLSLQNNVNLNDALRLLSVDLQNNNSISNIILATKGEYYLNKLNLADCTTITSLDLTTMKYLEELDLTGCKNLQHLVLPKNGRLKKCILTRCEKLTTLICDNLFQLETPDISGCTALTNISFIGCHKIKTLDLSSTTVNTCKIESCNELTSLTIKNKMIDDIVISGCEKLSKLNLSESRFTNDTLRLNGMQTLTDLNVGDCYGLKRIIFPRYDKNGNDWGSNFTTLNIYKCNDLNEISYDDGSGNITLNTGVFDFTFCTKLTSLSGFYNTDVVTVKNLTYNNCSSSMFCYTTQLKTLSNCNLSHTGSSLSMFFYNSAIQTFDNCTFKFQNATSISYMFSYCKNISEELVTSIINKSVCPKVTDATQAFANSGFSNSVLKYSWFNELPITKFISTFYNSNISEIQHSDFLKTSAKTSIDCRGMFANCTALTTVPNDIIANNQLIVNTPAMFYNCTKLKTVVNIYKNTALRDTSYMFRDCDSIKVTMNYMNVDINNINADNDAVPSTPNGLYANYGNFMYMSTYYLNNLTRCIDMYAGMNNLYGSDIESESCIPNNYFANNVNLTDITGMFRDCSNITCSLPDCLFNENGTTAITRAMSTFANTNITGIVGEKFFKGAENITILSFMRAKSGENIDSLSALLNNFNDHRIYSDQTISYGSVNDARTSGESFFFNTAITGYHDKCLWPLTKLTNVNYLFAKKRNLSSINNTDNKFTGTNVFTEYEYDDEDVRCCISPNTFRYNTEITSAEGCFFGQLGLTGVPSHNLFKHNTKLENVSSLFLGCYNLGSTTGNSAIEGVDSPAKMIDFSNCKISNYHATFAKCKKYVVSLYSDALDNYYPMNDTFKSTNNPTDISFMFSECPVLIRFEDDTLSDSNIEYAQFAFNQAYTNDSAVITYETDSPYFGITNSTGHNASCNSTISGNIPKYLFKNMTELKNASYMFSGTGVSGWIPSTMFDIDSNYQANKDIKIDYYYIDNKTYNDEHQFYYKNDNNEIVEYTSDAPPNVQKFSLGTYTYTERGDIKPLVSWTYFVNLKSLRYMFAYCTNLKHPGNSSTIYSGVPLYNDGDLIFDGYVPNDEGDYVLDDNTYKFRRYNPSTDDYNLTDNVYNEEYDINGNGNKQRYSQYNQCMLDDDVYKYNSISKSFTVNPGRVYFIHPDTFRFISHTGSNTIDLSGFTLHCNRLQGVISDVNLLKSMRNITSTADMFKHCMNLYGTVEGTINHLLDYQLLYLTSTARMFEYCHSLGRLDSVSCALTSAEMNPQQQYISGFMSNYQKNNVGIHYPGQEKLSSIYHFFYECRNLKGTVKHDQFINPGKHQKLSNNDSSRGAFANCYQLTFDGPNDSVLIKG